MQTTERDLLLEKFYALSYRMVKEGHVNRPKTRFALWGIAVAAVADNLRKELVCLFVARKAAIGYLLFTSLILSIVMLVVSMIRNNTVLAVAFAVLATTLIFLVLMYLIAVFLHRDN